MAAAFSRRDVERAGAQPVVLEMQAEVVQVFEERRAALVRCRVEMEVHQAVPGFDLEVDLAELLGMQPYGDAIGPIAAADDRRECRSHLVCGGR